MAMKVKFFKQLLDYGFREHKLKHEFNKVKCLTATPNAIAKSLLY